MSHVSECRRSQLRLNERPGNRALDGAENVLTLFSSENRSIWVSWPGMNRGGPGGVSGVMLLSPARVVTMRTMSSATPPAASRDEPASPEATDAALVLGMARRDEAALALLYDRYSGAAYGLAMRVLRDPATAQEVIHDVFLKLWQRPGLYDVQRGSVGTLLLTMVRHAAISKLRGVRLHLPLETEDGVPLPLPDPAAGPADHAETQARAERLGALLATLKPLQRETVERAYYRGESREAIALAMSVPVGTVKSRLKYALDRLRGLIGEEDW